MAHKLAICVATMQPKPFNLDPAGQPVRLNGSPGPGQIPLFTSNATEWPEVFVRYNTPEDNLGVIGSYQQLYEVARHHADLLAYVHDDVTMRERKWDERVKSEFEDPAVGLVGFGGALYHGREEIYKVPYRLVQLARDGYLSNVDDAEIHGSRFTGSCDVAVLDGFGLIVRRDILDKCGGWPVDRYPPMHLYDYWIAAMVHRLGYRIRVVGVRCHHHGGKTATSGEYMRWAEKTEWGSDAMMHEKGHRLFYEDFRDVLPWRC